MFSMKAVGRPRTSHLSRLEQLRCAKRAQRARERKTGQVEARIRLPRELARRLTFAARQPGFRSALAAMLESETVEVDRFAQLKLLCWNRRSFYLSAEDAWSLYERNWRFVETGKLESGEKRLIATLCARFGAGLPLA
jgi:hypothetical protein